MALSFDQRHSVRVGSAGRFAASARQHIGGNDKNQRTGIFLSLAADVLSRSASGAQPTPNPQSTLTQPTEKAFPSLRLSVSVSL